MAVCPQLQSNGVCTDSSCSYQHDVKICDDCGVICISTTVYKAHLAGKKHRKQVQGQSTVLHCAVCKRNIGRPQWKAHVSGAPHRKAATLKGVGVNVKAERPPAEDIPGNVYCGVCDVHIPHRYSATHFNSVIHRKKERFAAYKAAFEEAEKDKHGVSISGVVDLGIVEVADGAKGRAITLTVMMSVPSSPVTIVDVALSSAKDVRASSPFAIQTSAMTRSVLYRKPVNLVVTFRHSNLGRYEDRLEITFEDSQLRQRFVIVRPLRAIVGSRADHELLKPKAPYIPRSKRTAREPETDVVPGVPPDALNAIPYVGKLPKAEIPKPLAAALSTGSLKDMITSVRRAFMPSILNSSTYARHFKSLLWVEEFRMDHDLEMYDISNATLTQYRQFYYLAIPGLAEKRPSVLVGDRMLVQRQGDSKGKWYEGHVHFVRKEDVGLRFHESFRGWTKEQRYNVHFKLNRIPMKRQHQSLDTAFSQDRVLLPLATHVKGYPAPSLSLKPFNPLLRTNIPQLRAVVSILEQKPGDAPFALFGPPGTGKTVTIVEAIHQILKHNPDAHILACAPSNSAADLIAQRLTALTTDELFRFYAPSRDKEQVPDVLKSYSFTSNVRTSDPTMSKPTFSVPPISTMKRFKVIVSTCVSAGMPHGIGMPRGHFTHIFVDEAGQATEPEVMIPIKTMADNSTNIILSGDHKQLGPIIRSAVARELGLEKSYLERLMERDIYDVQRGNGNTVVKLVKNFRSHNAILKFPNERFYSGELQQCGDPTTINAFLNSPLLPSKKFPIVFHAISGKDVREASSPSFFNIDEISLVKEYVEKLRANRQVRITDHDIGIITPYHAQCQKMRTRLRGVADEVKVGSVEEFQGQERKVIIISTVRSSRDFVEYDLKHTLGFVANPRRFNVAVTRAKALLIVVGDPKVLSLDPLWRSFLNYVHIEGGWKGEAISWDPHAPVNEQGGYDETLRELSLADMNEFTRRMESLTLASVVPNEDDGDQETEANVDRPWREVE